MTLLNTDRLRIAIALTVLKHKDPHESFTSHILDLQAKFTSSTQLSTSNSWRDYALKLEREYAELKSKLNLSQTKLLILSNLPGTTDIHCATSSNPTSKKKKITSSTGKRDDHHLISKLNSMLAELADDGYHDNFQTGTATLFIALDHFAQLASLHELPDFPVDIFVSATQHVIHAASDVLHSILETNRNLNKLELLRKLMQFVIETSFLLLPLSPESFAYLLFNQLSGLLLSPVIRSFLPLSMISLGYLLEPATPSQRKGADTNGPDLHIDCRPKLLEFFQGIVSGLFTASCSLAKTTSGDGLCQDAFSMRDNLVLETIRHLKEILSPILVDNHNAGATGVERKKNPQAEDRVDSRRANLKKDLRVRRLAVKDAMWYLCSVFYILIGSRTPGNLFSTNSDKGVEVPADYMQHAGSDILEKNISRELFELLTDTRLRHPGRSWLSFGASQTLAGAGITGTAVKTALNALEEDRNVMQGEMPVQEILTSNKEANCLESNHKTYDSKKFSNHRTEAVDSIVTEGNHMHHILDDAERGMLLCVVERYVNEQ